MARENHDEHTEGHRGKPRAAKDPVGQLRHAPRHVTACTWKAAPQQPFQHKRQPESDDQVSQLPVAGALVPAESLKNLKNSESGLSSIVVPCPRMPVW